LLAVVVAVAELETVELAVVVAVVIEQHRVLPPHQVLHLQLLLERVVPLEAVNLVLLVVILYLAVLLQQVVVVVAKVVIHQQLTAALAVAVVNFWLVALVIRLALHHHKETMAVVL
jgi:hypothetical protein